MDSLLRRLRFLGVLYQLLLVPVLTSAELTCYCKNSVKGINEACGGAVPCYHAATGTQQCCIGDNECGDNGFCRAASLGPKLSGIYMGGCTDPDFKPPACAQQCSASKFIFRPMSPICLSAVSLAC